MTQPATELDTQMIETEFRRQLAEGLHSAATLAVFHNGKQVVDITYGARHSRPLFRALSMGKPLTAAVLWRYKARGNFDWDTPVAEFWPEFGTRGKSAITIGHVLSHSAGLASSATIPEGDHADWGRVIAHIEDMTPATQPGTVVHYHSQTFGWLVGEIASRVSGLPFEEAFAREVAFPLGLQNTSFTLEPSDFGRVVPITAGDDWDDQNRNLIGTKNAEQRLQTFMPSSSMLTTAQDIARFYSAISGKGKLNGVPWLPEEVINEVTTLRAEGPTRRQVTTLESASDFACLLIHPISTPPKTTPTPLATVVLRPARAGRVSTKTSRSPTSQIVPKKNYQTKCDSTPCRRQFETR
jgi:CubicO group peptidase (beta-lactamase class C family)